MTVAHFPRGIRLCNPLNIRHSKDHWLGLAADQPDPSFCRFVDMEHGVRAAALDLQAQGRHLAAAGSVVSVANIIARWAPASENDVSAYALDVMQRMGSSLSGPIDLHNAATLECLIAAMARHENGVAVDAGAIRRGVAMALNTSAAPADQPDPGGHKA